MSGPRDIELREACCLAFRNEEARVDHAEPARISASRKKTSRDSARQDFDDSPEQHPSTRVYSMWLRVGTIGETSRTSCKLSSSVWPDGGIRPYPAPPVKGVNRVIEREAVGKP